MRTQELIELAILDAMALLDDDERRVFERAYRAAPPAIQAQVRREQTRLSRIEAVLPRVDAPLGLRGRVLRAVREAVAAARCSTVKHTGGLRLIPQLIPSRKVSPLWRSGALGFAAAAIVFAVATLYMRSEFEDLLLTSRDSQLVDEGLQSAGPQFQSILFDHNVTRIVLTPENESVTAKASIWFDPAGDSYTLICQQLPAYDGEYQLVVLDDEGGVDHVLATFQSRGQLLRRTFDQTLAPGTRLAILTPASAPGGPVPVLSCTIPSARLG